MHCAAPRRTLRGSRTLLIAGRTPAPARTSGPLGRDSAAGRERTAALAACAWVVLAVGGGAAGRRGGDGGEVRGICRRVPLPPPPRRRRHAWDCLRRAARSRRPPPAAAEAMGARTGRATISTFGLHVPVRRRWGERLAWRRCVAVRDRAAPIAPLQMSWDVGMQGGAVPDLTLPRAGA